MAKILKNVTVTVKSNNYEATYKAEGAGISGTGIVSGRQHRSIQLFDCNLIEEPSGVPRGVEPSATEQDRNLYARHADTISNVLKQAECVRISAVARRETLEAEIAKEERVQRTKLRFAVHDAIQAGLDTEELTKDMRDDHAGYVSDMADAVYLATDLDSLIHVQDD